MWLPVQSGVLVTGTLHGLMARVLSGLNNAGFFGCGLQLV